MVNEALPIAMALCRRFEGLYLRPYLCPAGVPTIGLGSTKYADGRPVTLLDGAITEQYAEALLRWQLTTVYLPQVQRLCPGIDTPQRLAAILDFTYNLGASNLKNSTLRRCINSGEWDEVPAQLMRWNRGGGRILAGLTKRRAAESALI